MALVENRTWSVPGKLGHKLTGPVARGVVAYAYLYQTRYFPSLGSHTFEQRSKHSAAPLVGRNAY
jgi:hypothetical protein